MSVNPFDCDSGSFFFSVNDEEQHSVWPIFADVPSVAGLFTADRVACLDYFEKIWAEITPNRMRERLAVGPASDS